MQRTDFCLSCHDANGAQNITARDTGNPPEGAGPDFTDDPLDPFNDGVTNSHEPTGLDGKADSPPARSL